jgi:serine/threonine-protein kinase
MALQAGSCVGVYEIVGLLGAGGMGEVYRARDTKLRRDVALKVLPDLFARDPDRLARFTREAHVLASLSHPHIAAIYGIEEADGVTALVLELVEGPTLAERVEGLRAKGSGLVLSDPPVRGAGSTGPGLHLPEALKIAAQIADALEAAHEKGVVHRDLKPANIKLTADDRVKVLDFGLAKALESSSASLSGERDAMMSSTLTAMASKLGVIVGTAAYMSPEQAKGKAVDKRTDIWAFGCVLYEMLAGARAFAGDDVTDFIVSVMTKEPDWSRLPPSTPPRIVELLKRCLKKDPRERLRDIGDARLELDHPVDGIEPDRTATPLRNRALRSVWIGALAAVAVLSGLAGWSLRSDRANSPGSVRFSFPLPPVAQFASLNIGKMAMSPDGTRIAYAAGGQLYVRGVDQFEPVPVAASQGAGNPFFSPDGKWIGFVAGGRLQRVSLAGGAPLTISKVGQVAGASWGPDDTIVFGGGVGAGLQRVSVSGGTPVALTTPDPKKHEVNHGLPQFLPGGRDVVFTIGTGEGSRVALVSVETRTWRELLASGSGAQYLSSGHLLGSRQAGVE